MIHPDSKVFLNSRAVIDACRPYEWMNKFPEVAETSRELRKKVLGKFGRELFRTQMTISCERCELSDTDQIFDFGIGAIFTLFFVGILPTSS